MVRAQRFGYLGMWAACALMLSACESRDKPEPKPQHMAKTGSATSTDRTPEGLAKQRAAKGCVSVSDPEAGSPEWVIAELYASASSKVDDEASFARFYKQFGNSKDEQWVRTQYWPRTRQHVAKYIDEGGNFKLCRRKDDGDSKVRFFVKSNDTSKSDPPITLEKNKDGVWSVSKFSY